MTTIRPRTEADFPGLEEALLECHAKTGWPLEGVPDAKAFIAEAPDSGALYQAYVAEYDGEIVGHIAINAPVQHCPAVSLWREQQGKEGKLAVVGRLFVHPNKSGKNRGVTAGLVEAVKAWQREHNDTQMIMYCVIWSAARALIAHTLTARYGWYQYGDAVYTSPMDGRQVPAMCFAGTWQETDCLTVGDLVKEKGGVSLASNFSHFTSRLRIWWRDPGLWFKVACLRCGLALSRVLLPVTGGR